TAKKTKKQDIIDKSTKKKRKNGVLAYFMEKLVSENLVSENMLELVKECNTFMMMVADESMEKKKQHKGNTCKNRFCTICAWKNYRYDDIGLSYKKEFITHKVNKDSNILRAQS